MKTKLSFVIDLLNQIPENLQLCHDPEEVRRGILSIRLHFSREEQSLPEFPVNDAPSAIEHLSKISDLNIPSDFGDRAGDTWGALSVAMARAKDFLSSQSCVESTLQLSGHHS